jgi:DNA polymerase I-like protein with 3'-5' exonuclease and polymerase domains
MTSNLSSRYFVVDTETNSGAIHGELTEVHCVDIYYPDTNQHYTFHAPWFDDVDQQGHEPTVLDDLTQALSERVPIFHNSSFDLWVIQEYFGITFDKWHDTQVLSYLNNPMGSHALADWGLFFNFPKGDFTDYDAGWCPEMEKYVHRDTELTWKVFEHLFPKFLEDEALKWCYYNIDLPFTKQIIELEHNGIKIDQDNWKLVIHELEPILEGLLSQIKTLVPLAPVKLIKTKKERNPDTVCTFANMEKGKFVFDNLTEGEYGYYKIDDYNPNSDDQTAWALNHLYGWTPKTFSAKTGKPTVNKDVLVELHYDLATILIEYSRVEKLVSTYGQSLLDKVDEDGRLRANFNNCITLTGRLSSSSPNLQNIPSRGETGDKLRSLFVASEDCDLVGIDIDAFQMRIFAWYLKEMCDDDNLWLDFNTNEEADPHLVTANLIGVERKIGKTINFGSLFGIGAAKMSIQLKIPEVTAKGYLDKLRQAFPKFFDIKEQIWKLGKAARGNVYTMYGRKGYYPDLCKDDRSLSSRAQRQAFNMVIQGTEADLIKLWIVQLAKIFENRHLDPKLVLQVHDEFIYEVPVYQSREVADILNDYINGYDWLPTLRLKATAKIGKTWYEIH